MASKFKAKSEFLQKQFDDKEYGILFNFILKLKIDSTLKLVLILMANDTYMNGSITWKQMTYADKINVSRRQMINIFKELVDLKVIIPHKDNKEGGKRNKYTMTTNFEPLIKKPRGFAKKTCETGCTKPVKPAAPNLCTALHSTCEPDCTYNTTKTCTKHVLKKDGDAKTSPLSEPKKLKLTNDDILAQLINDI